VLWWAIMLNEVVWYAQSIWWRVKIWVYAESLILWDYSRSCWGNILTVYIDSLYCRIIAKDNTEAQELQWQITKSGYTEGLLLRLKLSGSAEWWWYGTMLTVYASASCEMVLMDYSYRSCWEIMLNSYAEHYCRIVMRDYLKGTCCEVMPHYYAKGL
jgi:hypothetical protein